MSLSKEQSCQDRFCDCCHGFQRWPDRTVKDSWFRGMVRVHKQHSMVNAKYPLLVDSCSWVFHCKFWPYLYDPSSSTTFFVCFGSLSLVCFSNPWEKIGNCCLPFSIVFCFGGFPRSFHSCSREVGFLTTHWNCWGFKHPESTGETKTHNRTQRSLIKTSNNYPMSQFQSVSYNIWFCWGCHRFHHQCQHTSAKFMRLFGTYINLSDTDLQIENGWVKYTVSKGSPNKKSTQFLPPMKPSSTNKTPPRKPPCIGLERVLGIRGEPQIP